MAVNRPAVAILTRKYRLRPSDEMEKMANLCLTKLSGECRKITQLNSVNTTVFP